MGRNRTYIGRTRTVHDGRRHPGRGRIHGVGPRVGADGGSFAGIDVAAVSGGRIAVAWNATTGSGTGAIVARVFDGGGTPVNSPVTLGTYAASALFDVQVAGRGGDRFVVGWSGNVFAGGTGTGLGAFARVVDANGNPVGGIDPVNETGSYIGVGLAAGGQYQVAWSGTEPGDTDTDGAVYIRGGETAGLFAFGTAVSPDRALGSIAGAPTGTVYYGVKLTNTGSTAIRSLNVAFDGEQWWSSGSPAQTLDFAYQVEAPSLTGGTWTDANGLDFTSPIFGTAAAPVNGNTTGKVSLQGTLAGLNLAPGQSIWLRWADTNDPSADHGLGIDNLVVTAPVPKETASGVGGTGHFGRKSWLGMEVCNVSPAPVRFADGVMSLGAVDLMADGAGGFFDLTRTWTNGSGYQADGSFGSGWVSSFDPYLVPVGTAVAVVASGTSAEYFDPTAGGNYATRFYSQNTLFHDTTAGTFRFTDTAGTVVTFTDFSAAWAANLRGQFVSAVQSDGTTVTVLSRTTAGEIADARRVRTVNGVTETSSLLFAYVASGPNAGLVESVTLRRDTGAGFANVRRVTYAYYAGEAGGTVGALKTAVEDDGFGAVLDTKYYRYYAGESGGYTGALKYVFNDAAYAQALTFFGSQSALFAAADSAVAPFADNYFAYDEAGRVTTETASAAGCSACSGGQGTTTFAYTTSGFAPGFNSWSTKTVTTLPDGTIDTVYTNAFAQVVLKSHQETVGGPAWVDYYRYDSAGRLVLHANPSAVTGFDEGYADLVRDIGGNALYLSDAAGLVSTWAYAAAATATDTTPGDAAGYLESTAIRRGEFGTEVPQASMTYIARTAGGVTTFHVTTDTVYANDDGTGERTTTYAYEWYAGAHTPTSVTTTMPTVSAAQNGSGTAAVVTTVFDQWGRPTWTKDADGFLTYTQSDPGTGAVVKSIADVNTALTGTFAGLPAGWVTPAGGGLHLTATAEVDSLGRTTKSVDPKGNVTYTVYDDDAHEVRTYQGWDAATNLPTGPTSVYRTDRAGRYSEMLTMSATPTVVGGRPDGTEAVANIQSLTRSYQNDAGQTVRTDTYFDLTGVTYSTAPNLGVQNTNFLRTTQDYDKQGRPNRSVSAAGTIYRTEYDGLGRVVSEWVGTDDTPTTGFWSVTNTAGTDMVKVREYQYDGGGVGDSNMTQATEFPGGGAADRVTVSWFDWRNRMVATKAGVEASESTDVNRPLAYTEFNNLGEVLSSEMYDGDAVTLVDADNNGVPDRPAGSLLRAKSTAEYDPWGRAFRSTVWSVDPATGAVSATGLVSQAWFDLRGNAVKSAAPGGLVAKAAFDGVGRTTVAFTTDGGGDTGYADAFTVAGDIVLAQTEYTYDANSNVILTTMRERFHDTTLTGALGTPMSGVPARVSYSTAYFDSADRTTAVVNLGTNGGAAYTRPATVPARSDTVLVTSYAYDAAGRLEFVTDPRALVSRTVYDLMGRTTATVANYVDGVVSDGDDKTTVYAYGPAGVTSLTTLVTAGGGQATEWVYGVSAATGSGIASNDIVGATRWPDPTTGVASAAEQETTTVNALGQTRTATDRNGSVHTLSYDVLGRVVSDAVTTLGAGVDGAVRRIEYAYDGQGNQFLVSSFSAAAGGTLVNQVKREFNGLGQLTAVWQSHAGAVTASTPKVSYTYSEMTGGANHSRLTTMTYPSGFSTRVDYGASIYTDQAALNDRISRVSDTFSPSDNTLIQAFDYLGLGTVVRDARGNSVGMWLTDIAGGGPGSDGGDQYTAWDRFGRLVDLQWYTGDQDRVTDRWAMSYDRNGNRLAAVNLVDGDFTQTYAYDGLNQLVAFARGARTQTWNYDSQGNFESVTTNGVTENRSHNKQNEVTGVGASVLAFDANGNMTTDETGRQFVYDAWNRLVAVKDSGGVVQKTFGYDGQGWRVTETVGATVRDLYYSAGWQVVEETVTTGGVTKLNARYVWGQGYVDDLVYRQRDTNNDGVLDERLWATHDANFNITSLADDAGWVVERYAYDPYGVRTVFDATNLVRAPEGVYDFWYGFQGLRYDATAGLSDARNRWYSPTLGRFVTVDPIRYEAGDVNLYRFVGNSPGTGVDPWGLAAEKGCEDKEQDPCAFAKQWLYYVQLYNALKIGADLIDNVTSVLTVGTSTLITPIKKEAKKDLTKTTLRKALSTLEQRVVDSIKDIEDDKINNKRLGKAVLLDMAKKLSKAMLDNVLDGNTACYHVAVCETAKGNPKGIIEFGYVDALGNRRVLSKCEWKDGKSSFKTWGWNYKFGLDKWEGVD